ATPVGGIPEVLGQELGILLPERSVSAAIKGLRTGLAKDWDRDQIRQTMEQRSWMKTAEQVDSVFQAALNQSTASDS
ncbi:MAG: hypothetical protein MI861_11870, partial [Pirellulales bacterium]|nr:hypothetical protein [Pirellulales bacterium]